MKLQKVMQWYQYGNKYRIDKIYKFVFIDYNKWKTKVFGHILHSVCMKNIFLLILKFKHIEEIKYYKFQ